MFDFHRFGPAAAPSGPTYARDNWPRAIIRRRVRRWAVAYQDFSFPEIQQLLSLNLTEMDLFSSIPPLSVPAAFAERMRGDIALALAINTEKARSEFIIAPLLSELR